MRFEVRLASRWMSVLALTVFGCSSSAPDPCAGPDFGMASDADGDGVPDECDVCANGDDNRDVNANGTPDACECIGAMCTCADAANPVTYYLDSLTIPTEVMAETGDVVGYDLDGFPGAEFVDGDLITPGPCNEMDHGMDWAGQVDNAFLDLRGQLQFDGVDLQRLISDALWRNNDQLGLDLRLTVSLGAGCAAIDVYSGAIDAAPVASFAATNVNGVLRGVMEQLPLVIPYEDSAASEFTLALTQIEFTATLGTNGLTDILLGGSLSHPDLLEFAQTLAEPFVCEPGGPVTVPCALADPGVSAGAMDLPHPSSGDCGRAGSLSVGLFATASTSPISTVCPPAAT